MKRVFFLLVAVISLATCYKEPGGDRVKRAVILKASTENPLDFVSKTVIDGPGIVWSGVESINVFTSDGENARFSADGNGSIGTFTGDSLSGKMLYAIYPYAVGNTLDGSMITFTLPREQKYARSSFGQGANVSVGSIKEWADDAGSIDFKNVCGYVKVSLTLDPGDVASVGRIVLTDLNNVLSGTFTVDAEADEPVATYLESAEDGSHSITLDIPDSESVMLSDSYSTDFYFVVPDGTCLDGFKVDVYSNQGHLIKNIRSSNTVPVRRNHVMRMPVERLSWLPVGYRESEYIQSTTYQPINTGVSANAEFSLHMRMSLTETPVEADYAFYVLAGTWDETDAIWMRLQFLPGGEPSEVEYRWTRQADCMFLGNYIHRDASYYTVGKIVDIEWINKLSERRITVDGTSDYHSNVLGTVPATMPYPLYLFSANYKNTRDRAYPSKMKLYDAVFYDGADTMVRNFVPAYRESDGSYGLYEASKTVPYGDSFFYTAINGVSFTGHRHDEDPTLEFSSFSIEGGEILTTTEDNLIVVCVPNGTDLTNLVATFETNAQEVQVNEQPQRSGVTANDFSNIVTYRLVSPSGGGNYYRVKVYDFSLPTVWISTADGSEITSKTEWKEGATISIYDGTRINLTGTTQIRGRGNSTWAGKKKPYTFKLDSKASVLGLNGGGKDKRWNLIANYYDRSRIRNDLALELAHRSPGIAWSPYGTFVELILNGEHKGNYYLCEHIKISKDRVKVYEQDENEEKTHPQGFDYSGGYLLEFDTYFDENNRFRSAVCDYPVNLKSPDWEGYDMTYICNWINSLETKLAGDDIASTDYRDYLDIDSYIDYWFVFELMGNRELEHPKSAYMYKDRDVSPYVDSKIHAGPVWDFDMCRFGEQVEGWVAKEMLWYMFLFKDPAFVARVKEKWNAQKADYQDLADIYINDLSARIKGSVEHDLAMWKYESEEGQLTFDELVARFKAVFPHRILWMDTEINSW